MSAAATWELWAALVLLISPAIGSFLGVLVERLPHGQSILTPSRCASCSAPLRWSQMVPIASALVLRGRCAACRAPIPGHLMRIEIASVAVAVLAVWLASDPALMLALALSFWCLVALFYTDLLVFRLPDPLTAALFICALAAAWLTPGRDLLEALGSGCGAAAVFWAIRAGYQALRGREGMGLGDVKLAAGIGALVGWQLVPLVALLAALLALVTAALDAAIKRQWPAGATALPFGSFLAGATLLVAAYTL